jgi:hypothetical protein
MTDYPTYVASVSDLKSNDYTGTLSIFLAGYYGPGTLDGRCRRPD